MGHNPMITAALVAVMVSSAGAQTADTTCRELAYPPGVGSAADRSWSRCALSSTPRLLSPMDLPAPEYGRRAGMSVFIVVNADGRVDSALTRLWTVSDAQFAERSLAAIRGWRFEPGMRGQQPVRSNFTLHVRSDQRIDTVASFMVWTHRPMQPVTDRNVGPADSLIGEWFPIAVQPPRFTEAEEDRIYAAALDELKRQGAFALTDGASYCLAPSGTAIDSLRLMRLAERLGPQSGNACNQPATRRVHLPPIHTTENGRAVLTLTGDHLPRFPPDLSGRSYRRWTARCVGYAAIRPARTTLCGLEPLETWDELRAGAENRRRASPTVQPPRSVKDTVVARLYVTTVGAIGIDTLPPRLLRIPRFAERTRTENPGPCGAWQLFTPERGRDLFVLHGEIDGRFLTATDATAGTPRAPSGDATDCRGGPRLREFFAFIPGEMGDAPVDSLTLWFQGAAQPVVLGPSRHLVEPMFRFRLEGIRPESRSGTRVDMRIVLDGAAAETYPIFVVRRGSGRPIVAFGRRLSENTWEYPWMNSDGSGTGVQYFIYVFTR